ncbi:MAG: gamma-glutamyl-gamma-aminobutyrate hydrolase family protein [Bacillota bacterium]
MNNILISQRISINKHGTKIDSLESSYIKYLNNLGFNIIPVPNFIGDLNFFLSEIDFNGVILSGGGSINYKYFKNNNTTGEIDFFREREKTENKLIEYSLREQIPILGICRGMQHLNCFFGGKLTGDYYYKKREPGQPHKIYFNKGNNSLLKVINHYHNDAVEVEDVAKNFNILAFDDDYKTVEAIYDQNKKILGIQWHPERFEKTNIFSEKLIKDFLGGDLN